MCVCANGPSHTAPHNAMWSSGSSRLSCFVHVSLSSQLPIAVRLGSAWLGAVCVQTARALCTPVPPLSEVIGSSWEPLQTLQCVRCESVSPATRPAPPRAVPTQAHALTGFIHQLSQHQQLTARRLGAARRGAVRLGEPLESVSSLRRVGGGLQLSQFPTVSPPLPPTILLQCMCVSVHALRRSASPFCPGTCK